MHEVGDSHAASKESGESVIGMAYSFFDDGLALVVVDFGAFDLETVGSLYFHAI